jgi:hypothetical protein
MRRLTALGDTKRAFGSRLSACALFNRARLNARGDGGGASAQGLRPMSPTIPILFARMSAIQG